MYTVPFAMYRKDGRPPQELAAHLFSVVGAAGAARA